MAPTKMSESVLTFRLCMCAFLVSIGINFTRVPIIYGFRDMTCDDYYQSHAPYRGIGDKCSIPQIEAKAATAVSILGATITINGVVNLIFANWSMKTFGIKAVLIQQLVGPTIRLVCQYVGVKIGGSKGILAVEISQLLGVVGGSTGYQLILTTFTSCVVSGSEQTAAFGRLQGAIMSGTAVAYLVGGTISNRFGIGAAFQGACAVMLLSTLYAQLALPHLAPLKSSPDTIPISGLSKILGPFKTLMSTKSIQFPGKKSYQRPLLSLGIFFGVLATGFIPTLLQLYSTSAFGFTAEDNGYLMALTFGVRSLFLTFVFPIIIKSGREWLRPRDAQAKSNSSDNDETAPLLPDPYKGEEERVDTVFDLWFLTGSFFVDALFTGATAFVQEGWQLYAAAGILPLASGSAPAAKGFIVSLCEPWERGDALSGIAMVEMLATVLTMAVFGFIFSTLVAIQRSSYVFFVNGGLALAATFLVFFIRAPRKASVMEPGSMAT